MPAGTSWSSSTKASKMDDSEEIANSGTVARGRLVRGVGVFFGARRLLVDSREGEGVRGRGGRLYPSYV